MKCIWIVKGETSGAEDVLYDGICPPKGTVEWQFSDGPPGERGGSSDYICLETGMRENSPAFFHFVDS